MLQTWACVGQSCTIRAHDRTERPRMADYKLSVVKHQGKNNHFVMLWIVSKRQLLQHLSDNRFLWSVSLVKLQCLSSFQNQVTVISSFLLLSLSVHPPISCRTAFFPSAQMVCSVWCMCYRHWAALVLISVSRTQRLSTDEHPRTSTNFSPESPRGKPYH